MYVVWNREEDGYQEEIEFHIDMKGQLLNQKTRINHKLFIWHLNTSFSKHKMKFILPQVFLIL